MFVYLNIDYPSTLSHPSESNRGKNNIYKHNLNVVFKVEQYTYDPIHLSFFRWRTFKDMHLWKKEENQMCLHEYQFSLNPKWNSNYRYLHAWEIGLENWKYFARSTCSAKGRPLYIGNTLRNPWPLGNALAFSLESWYLMFYNCSTGNCSHAKDVDMLRGVGVATSQQYSI